MPTTAKPKAKQSIIMKGLPWIAVVAVVAAISLFVHTTLFYINAKEATCSVLAVEVINGSSKGNTYRPTIQYTDDQGLNHVVDFAIATSYYNFSVGQKVAILYDPTSPQSVRFDSFMGTWGLTAGIAITAVIILLIAWGARAAQREIQRKKGIREGKILADQGEENDLAAH